MVDGLHTCILDQALSFLEKLDHFNSTLICLLKGPIKWIESNHKIDGPYSSNSNLKSIDLILRLSKWPSRPNDTTSISNGPQNPLKWKPSRSDVPPIFSHVLLSCKFFIPILNVIKPPL